MAPNTRLSQAKLGYLAGFLDADGCITVSKVLRNTWKPLYQVRLQATNTDRPVLDWIMQTLGCGAVVLHNKSAPKRHNTAWRWSVGRREILQPVLEALLPYMRIKQSRARLAISLIEEATSEKPSQRKMNMLYQHIRTLNKRGRVS